MRLIECEAEKILDQICEDLRIGLSPTNAMHRACLTSKEYASITKADDAKLRVRQAQADYKKTLVEIVNQKIKEHPTLAFRVLAAIDPAWGKKADKKDGRFGKSLQVEKMSDEELQKIVANDLS